MMDARDDQRQNGSSAGICYGAGQPKAAAAERALDRRNAALQIRIGTTPVENRILRSQLPKRLRLTDAQ